MFTKILVANRGEIACRVMRTAQRLGIKTVAVYSDADASALHVSMADEAFCIGGAAPRDSYLRLDIIIDIAIKTGAQAIHPGYGFLSENAAFAQACKQHGIAFIGPPVSAIEAMGSKSVAKRLMEAAGVPLVPGYHGEAQDDTTLIQAAQTIPYPLLIKAAAGGGGKGMRVVREPGELQDAIASARREAISGFADGTLLIERYIEQPRHVEIQVFADNHGNCIYLHERDCSIQRRHQKIIEEAPAPGLSPELRQQMGDAAVRAALSVGYSGAGTVEMLLAPDGSFYFMEMNTRLQVEHPVTEMITGLDLVEWQLQVANNQILPLTQTQVPLMGHAFEARLYAEDPDKDFLPATGTLEWLAFPDDDTRIDTGVRRGDSISPFYDPMIAKVIVHGSTREEALQKMHKALCQCEAHGVHTNLRFLRALAAHPAFIAGAVHTGFIPQHHSALFAAPGIDLTLANKLVAIYEALRLSSQPGNCANDPHSPWGLTGGWRQAKTAFIPVRLQHNDQHSTQRCDIAVEQCHAGQHCHDWRIEGEAIHATLDGHCLHARIGTTPYSVNILDHQHSIVIFLNGEAIHFERPQTGNAHNDTQDHGLHAPMNGTIINVAVSAGQQVSAGDPLLILEAMKMEYVIRAPEDGLIEAVFFHAGEQVKEGEALLAFASGEAS